MQNITEHFLKILNEAFQADPNAMHSLIVNHVPCNEKLANHPTIQVDLDRVLEGNHFSVGLIGILNGILENLNGERIAAQFEQKNGKPILVGFCKYQETL